MDFLGKDIIILIAIPVIFCIFVLFIVLKTKGYFVAQSRARKLKQIKENLKISQKDGRPE